MLGRHVEPAETELAEASPLYEVDEVTCDGLDNDCDGRIDEGLLPRVPLPGVCGEVQLNCDALGEAAQLSRTDFLTLIPDAYEEIETRCDGLDNDCDGFVDEGSPPLPNETFGVCLRLAGKCEGGRPRMPTAEEYAAELGVVYEVDEARCDGLDNDCDGIVDEQPLAAPAYRRGVCADARQVCVSPFLTRPPMPEDYRRQNIADYDETEDKCDGLDNDCDGVVDERPRVECGLPSLQVEQLWPATCRPGLLGCLDDVEQCIGAIRPEPENCYGGADEDCDGRVNNGCHGGQCDGDADCPEGAVCDLELAGGTCVAPCRCDACDLCRARGAADCTDACEHCETMAEACEAEGGHCVIDPLQPGGEQICRAGCLVQDDCRAGFRCRLIGEIRACLPQ